MQELKLESKNVRLNARLFKSCEQSFSVTCPKIAGIVEIEAGALSNSESEELIDCMMNNRNVRVQVSILLCAWISQYRTCRCC